MIRWATITLGADGWLLRLLGALEELGVPAGEEFVVARAEQAIRSRREESNLYGLEEADDNLIGAARSRAREEAREAARRNKPRSGTQRYRVLRALVMAGPRGLISDEISDRTGIPNQSVKPRLLELAEGGWADKTARSRDSWLGSPTTVFRATPKGEAFMAEKERRAA